jgi:hypothetical protein
MATLTDKQHAHELIERLDSNMITTAVRFLEFIAMDPVARSIAIAPVDSEPLTDEEAQAIRRSEAWFERNGGKGTPMEEVLADFGLSMKDFPPEKRGA